MYNNKLVYTMIVLGVLEIITLLISGYFVLFNGLEYSVAFKTLSVSHLILHSAFFVILLIYQRYQERYVFLSIVTILVLLTFQFVFFNYFDNTITTSLFADANIILSGIMLFLAMLVGVDDSTYPFVKRIVVYNTFALIIFKTPIFFVVVAIVERFFNSTEMIQNEVWLAVIAFQYLLFAILNGFKIKMFNRIDFV